MAAYNVSLASLTATGTFVQDYHFGTNALHGVNVSPDGDMLPQDGFVAAVDALDLTHLRYPGGHAENTLDVTRLENGQLRAEVRAFMDWVVANSTPDNMIQVTLVLPTKVDIPAAQIEAFVYLLLEQYGDHVTGLEIGNEYSIGRRVEGFDRSTHPEENPDSDFVSSMTESEYGIAANRVINATQDAIDRLAEDRPGLGHDPAILIQLGDTNGAGSAYKGNGSWDEANEAILEWLDHRALDAIDGAVAHYYYNQSHVETQAFEGTYQEVRSLDQRIDNFNEHLGRDVPLYITEWNVLNTNMNQQGMAAASTLLEMFEVMVQLDTADAFIWPLQHRTSNTVAGNRSEDGVDLSAGGGAFKLMADTLRPETSVETGHKDRFESIETEWTGSTGEVETNYYASAYHDVIYVSLRDLDPSTINFDLRPFLAEAVSVDVTRMTMDPASSDGLSDLADENGLNRLGRRDIDADEYAILSNLGFFDPSNKNHIQITGDGQYRTYLPTATGIVALTGNPDSVDDYYFATETDVDPLFVTLTGDFLNSGTVALNMMPYDVAQIVIEKKWVQKGDSGDESLTGGIGMDVILGRQGNDIISTGEGNDTLKGGYGDDLLNAGSGDDSIVAGDGNDTILAGAGDDLIEAGRGTKAINGGTGKDTLWLDGSTTDYTASVNNGQLRLIGDGLDARIENVEILIFADQRLSVTDYLNGLGGGPTDQPKTHYGTAFDDELNGSPDNEILSGDAGDDILLGNSGLDTLMGGDGTDLLIAEDRGLYGTDASEQIYRIYKAVFGREPDVNGHQFWVTQLASTARTHADIAKGFMASPEFQSTYGTTTDVEFVTLLYNNVLGRAPDPGGLDAWLSFLSEGMTRQMVVRHFAESPENKSATYESQIDFDARWDATTWTDDVFRLFQTVFDRAPDAEEFQDWTHSLSNGISLDSAVNTLMASAEFQTSLGATTNAQFVADLYQNTPGSDASDSAAWISALDAGLNRADVVIGVMNAPDAAAASQPAVKAYVQSLGLDDVLEAGRGNDFLSGGVGSDKFVFDTTDDGTHTVTDLEPWDIIDISDFGYADVDAALARMQQQGDDVVFHDQSVTVIFSDIALGSITDDMIALL